MADAHSKAVDSLLNFETVKYFGNEKLEAARFDRSMARYENAAVRIWTSLAWLNIGQIVIFTIGMTVCMVLSASAVMRGEQTLGDFVLINALLLQLSIPLNFIGSVYREIKQALIDIDDMFKIIERDPEIQDRPGAKALDVEIPVGAARILRRRGRGGGKRTERGKFDRHSGHRGELQTNKPRRQAFNAHRADRLHPRGGAS